MSTAITRFLMMRADEVILYNRGISATKITESSRRILGDRTNYAVSNLPAFFTLLCSGLEALSISKIPIQFSTA